MKSFDGESDDELVARARASGGQDTRPFEALIRRHQGFVAANCRAITRSGADVDDLAQEIFVKAFFGLRRFEGRAQFRTWLQRIKVNHCLSHLRKTQGAIMVDLDEVGPESHGAMALAPNAYVAAESAMTRDRIMSVLDTMADTLRIPLMLRDADGHSYEEIASQLGISLSAVKMRIKRAREEFRRRFADASLSKPSPEAGVASL
ncbi:MAG: RNA polymerase sigma factor [Vicinamibacterales bacterium]